MNHHHGAKRIKIKKNKMALCGLYVLIFMFYLVLSIFSPYADGKVQVTQLINHPACHIGLGQTSWGGIF